MTQFILHVWTANPKETPWALHIDGAQPLLLQHVSVDVPIRTRNSGHRPCADWYLEFESDNYMIFEDRVEVFLPIGST